MTHPTRHDTPVSSGTTTTAPPPRPHHDQVSQTSAERFPQRPCPHGAGTHAMPHHAPVTRAWAWVGHNGSPPHPHDEPPCHKHPTELRPQLPSATPTPPQEPKPPSGDRYPGHKQAPLPAHQ